MIEPTITFDKIQLFNADNMEVMKQYPDKYFDIGIIDPPYGIGEDGLKNHSRSKLAKTTKFTPKNWDSDTPTQEFFNEFIRVSKNHIIWGANHFISKIPFDSSCWIVWDKVNGVSDFADCELAYTSFDTAVRQFTFRWAGMLQQDMKNKEERIHPTQKPVALYSWIIKNYVKPNMKILDTHLGSGSQTIAIDKANTIENMNLEFVGIEIDSEYFNDSVQRFKNYKQQKTIFD